MPIAFDPPTHAPHGTLPTRGARSVEDDPASLDIFTQLLLAAASVQDASAPPEPSARAAKDTPASGDPSVLCLPLPAPLLAGTVPAANTVTIVASEKMGDMRAASASEGRSLVEALRAARAGSTGLAPAASATATPATATTLANTATAGAAQPSPQAPTAAALSAAAPDPTERDAASASTHARPAAPAVTSAATTLMSLVTPLATAADEPSAATKGVEPAPAAALQAVAPATPQPLPPVLVETVSAPAFTPGWQDETVSKLAHIVLTRNERAELRLNPAELGPVNVRVELRADQLSVQIVAASPETRSALEQSLPQLRDLLATQGITLGQASVHDGAPQRDARPEAWTRPSSQDPATTASGRADTVQTIVRRADRLLDLYA
jgi:flagellar hook-length control protein FliK